MTRFQRGQAIIEFGLAFPIYLAVVIGIINFAPAYFQSGAISNAAQAAAREASITTNFTTSRAGNECESGSPETIAEAAQQGATSQVSVNQGLLCDTSSSPDVFTQPPGPGASIELTVTGTSAAPTSFHVQITYQSHPLVADLGIPLTLTGQSTVEAQ